MYQSKYKKIAYFHGVTLLEILLATIIIGILVVSIIAFLQNFSQSTIIKHTQQRMRHIADLAILYHLHHDAWPNTFQDLETAGLISPIEQCSPWLGESTESPCKESKHVAFTIATSNNQFLVKLTLDDPLKLEKIANNLANSQIEDKTLTIYTPTPQQAFPGAEIGVFRLIGYTSRTRENYSDNQRKKDGNGLTIPLNSPTQCPPGTIPIVFNNAYKFTCPTLRWYEGGFLPGVNCASAMKYQDVVAIGRDASPSSYSVDNPPSKAKLCVRTHSDAFADTASVNDGYKDSKLRFFVVCLDKTRVMNNKAPPYDAYGQNGNNVLSATSQYNWCTSM